MLLAILGIIVGGIVLLVLLGILMAILGTIFGLVFGAIALVMKALPLLVIGYIVVKLIQRGESRRVVYRGRDESWLDRRV